MLDLNFRLPEYDTALAALPAPPATEVASNERYWTQVRSVYQVSTQYANLENGFWGPMAQPVKAMLAHWSERVNFENTALIRAHWPLAEEHIRMHVAQALGCAVDEVALTRGATEGMLALISGFKELRPGEQVLYCDLDYPAMRHAMQWLQERRGVQALAFAMPEPATQSDIMQAYAEQLQRHPNIRLVLLTHISHATGLVLPVAQLSAMAQAAGAQVIVDAAHSWGQMDFQIRDLQAPFVALNLHKWIGAPLGCGCIYIRRDRLAAIDRYFGDAQFNDLDVRSRIHTGTPNFAAWLSIPAALQLHQHIGARAKAARLHALRNTWVEQMSALHQIEITTSADTSAGITSFRIKGQTSPIQNMALAARLKNEHGVLVVQRDGPCKGSVLRVTPAITSTHAELERLVQAIHNITQ